MIQYFRNFTLCNNNNNNRNSAKKPSDKTSPRCSVTYVHATGHSFMQTGAFDFQTHSCMLITTYLHGQSACSHAP